MVILTNSVREKKTSEVNSLSASSCSTNCSAHDQRQRQRIARLLLIFCYGCAFRRACVLIRTSCAIHLSGALRWWKWERDTRKKEKWTKKKHSSTRSKTIEHDQLLTNNKSISVSERLCWCRCRTDNNKLAWKNMLLLALVTARQFAIGTATEFYEQQRMMRKVRSETPNRYHDEMLTAAAVARETRRHPPQKHRDRRNGFSMYASQQQQ